MAEDGFPSLPGYVGSEDQTDEGGLDASNTKSDRLESVVVNLRIDGGTFLEMAISQSVIIDLQRHNLILTRPTSPQ